MSRSEVLIHATPDVVFDVLDDPYAYPHWVIGTRRIRHVDPHWPTVGTRFHHAIGTFAAELHDSTLVLGRERPDSLELEVRFRPSGVARVRLSVVAEAHGSRLTLEETPVSGPIERIPRIVTDPALALRNAASLRRLRRLVEHRASGR